MRAKHNTAQPLKVMVVDDSAVVRKIFSELISSTADMLLISTASDPIFAMRHMKKELPDVIVLDIEMPRMDGVTFLKKLMCEQPIPVVICSTLTEDGNDMAFQAMSAGAVGLIPKPKVGIKDYLHGERDLILNTLRSAAISDLSNINKPVRAGQKINSVDKTLTKPSRISPKAVATSEKYSADVILNSSSQSIKQTTEQVIAIGTSTGGTQALEKVLTALPRLTPGIVVVQHMPEKFTKAFAKRLDSFCAIDVKEAVDGDRVIEGQALIAPGAKHMLLKRSGAKYYVEVKDGPLVNRHKPSVDVLFRSVANIAGKNAIGIIMTGMGDDGARGLCEMHHTGATTYAQDEDSCVVFGMPKEAIRLGGVDIIVPLDEIATTIQQVISSGS